MIWSSTSTVAISLEGVLPMRYMSFFSETRRYIQVFSAKLCRCRAGTAFSGPVHVTAFTMGLRFSMGLRVRSYNKSTPATKPAI